MQLKCIYELELKSLRNEFKNRIKFKRIAVDGVLWPCNIAVEINAKSYVSSLMLRIELRKFLATNKIGVSNV